MTAIARRMSAIARRMTAAGMAAGMMIIAGWLQTAGNTLTAAAGNIPDWEKKAAIMSKPTPARCRKEQR